MNKSVFKLKGEKKQTKVCKNKQITANPIGSKNATERKSRKALSSATAEQGNKKSAKRQTKSPEWLSGKIRDDTSNKTNF